MNLIKLEHKDITNDTGINSVMFISYNNILVGMIKLSDFNNWYPVFVHSVFGYNSEDKTFIMDSSKRSTYLTDIADLLYSSGFEIYIQNK